MGGVDLNPARRRSKRERVVQLCLFVLSHEPNGMRIQELQRLVDQAFRFRCSSNSIGQYLLPFVNNGTLEKDFTNEGNAYYRYNDPMETA